MESSGGEDIDERLERRAAQLLTGLDYLQWLRFLHEKRAPRTYLEIGVDKGTSLALAACPAIGIDPAYQLEGEPRASHRLFRQTSDEFFLQHSPKEIFQEPIGLAFIDGLHTFDQAFRDIVNVAKHCGPTSVILVHDVLPVDEISARRERAISFWTGDVWKIAPMIRRLLPAVEMFTLPIYPSGLMVLRNVAGSDPDPAAWKALEQRLMQRPFPPSIAELARVVALRAMSRNQLLELISSR